MGKLIELKGDKRRKHRHLLVTKIFQDGERFGRAYTVPQKAERFADRQRKSPVVKNVVGAKPKLTAQ